MKCEIHGTEMKWEGDMLTGGPVCPCCNLPDYEEEDLREKFMENQLTKRLLEKSTPRNRESFIGEFKPEPSPHKQTGRTSRALYNLIKECSERNCTATYVVHQSAMFRLIGGLLKDMYGDGIDSRQVGSDRFLVSFRGMPPIALILATPETNIVGIKGRIAYDHFIYEEKALARRIFGNSGAGRGD